MSDVWPTRTVAGALQKEGGVGRLVTSRTPHQRVASVDTQDQVPEAELRHEIRWVRSDYGASGSGLNNVSS